STWSIGTHFSLLPESCLRQTFMISEQSVILDIFVNHLIKIALHKRQLVANPAFRLIRILINSRLYIIAVIESSYDLLNLHKSMNNLVHAFVISFHRLVCVDYVLHFLDTIKDAFQVSVKR